MSTPQHCTCTCICIYVCLIAGQWNTWADSQRWLKLQNRLDGGTGFNTLQLHLKTEITICIYIFKCLWYSECRYEPIQGARVGRTTAESEAGAVHDQLRLHHPMT